ncbi:unnamed protein product [Enterobius vermicularis]|uniref:MATH domain-containing protein n=1 Tax=Enterobius vermicularis TaxID=51028 RepID=A0A0N4V2L6_ENTVE|nr:unnamed protein product [Enterobius vermicularis]
MEIHNQTRGFFYTTTTTTKPKIERFRYEWKLEKFSKFHQSNVETFIALCRGEKRYKWFLKLYPKHQQTVGAKAVEFGPKYVLINLYKHEDEEATWNESDGYRAKISLVAGNSNRVLGGTKSMSSRTAFGLIASRDAVLKAILPTDQLIVRVDFEIVVETQSICSFVSKTVEQGSENAVRKSTDSIQKRKDVDEDSDFCVLSTPSKGSCGNTSGAAGVGIGADDGAVSEEDSDDDWVVADVAETITATPEVVLEKFNEYFASKKATRRPENSSRVQTSATLSQKVPCKVEAKSFGTVTEEKEVGS